MADDQFDILGTTGLEQYGGMVYEEQLPQLQGRRGVMLYREMSDNCAVIGAMLYAIEALFRQVQWRVEPFDESEQAVAAAEFIETVFGDMSSTMSDTISEISTMLVFGWSYLEIVWKTRQGSTNDGRTRSRFDDGMIGVRMLSLRAQDSLDRWEFDDDGGIQGMHQLDTYGNSAPVFIPIDRALLFRTRTNKNNPEGRSILRNAFRSWWRLRRLQEQEAIGAERDLTGILHIQVPMEIMSRTATSNQRAIRQDLEKMGQQYKRNERDCLITPPELDRDGNPTGYKIGMLQSPGKRVFPINEIITRYETRILQSVLAEFIMLGTESVGSFALHSNKTKLFAVALGSMLDNIESVFNRFLVPKIIRMNGLDETLMPKLQHGDIESRPLEEVSGYVSQLASVGALTIDPGLEGKLREVGDLPQLDGEELA